MPPTGRATRLSRHRAPIDKRFRVGGLAVALARELVVGEESRQGLAERQAAREIKRERGVHIAVVVVNARLERATYVNDGKYFHS